MIPNLIQILHRAVDVEVQICVVDLSAEIQNQLSRWRCQISDWRQLACLVIGRSIERFLGRPR